MNSRVMNARVRLCAALITGSTVVAGSMVLADSAWALVGVSDGSSVSVSPRTDGGRGPETPAPDETPAAPVAPTDPAPAAPAAPAPTPTASTPTKSPVVVEVMPPKVKDAAEAPKPVPVAPRKDSKTDPSTSKVFIGKEEATCTQTTSNGQLLTSCGVNPEPPPVKKLYCNSLTKRDAPPALAQRLAPMPGPLVPGLYVHVIDGLVSLKNRGGTQIFSAGQFGFTPSFIQPPIVVPPNPGITFNPPPAFNPGPSGGAGSGSGGSKPVDCEVRSGRLPLAASEPKLPAGLSVAQGGVAFINAGGLLASSPVSIALVADPMETLADVMADADGNLAVWVRLPASTPVGDGILQVNGYTAEGYTVTVNSGMTVRAAVPQAVKEPVYFWYQSDRLTSKAKAALVAALSEVPATVPSTCTIAPAVRAEGATAALIELAENRAQAVAAYLNGRGVSCTVDNEPDTTTSASSKSRRSTVTIRFAN